MKKKKNSNAILHQEQPDVHIIQTLILHEILQTPLRGETPVLSHLLPLQKQMMCPDAICMLPPRAPHCITEKQAKAHTPSQGFPYCHDVIASSGRCFALWGGVMTTTAKTTTTTAAEKVVRWSSGRRQASATFERVNTRSRCRIQRIKKVCVNEWNKGPNTALVQRCAVTAAHIHNRDGMRWF